MRNYYYFAATLPPVVYGDPPPMSSAEFRALCGERLHPQDVKALAYCSYDPRVTAEAPVAGSRFIGLLTARERTFVQNLVHLRAIRLKRPVLDDAPNEVSDAGALAKAAFEMDDPLQAELLIDRGRWDALDALVGLDMFSVNVIYAYLMKLQLLERKQLFDAEKGFDGYKRLYDAILNEYSGSEGGA